MKTSTLIAIVVCAMVFLVSCQEETPSQNQPSVTKVSNKMDGKAAQENIANNNSDENSDEAIKEPEKKSVGHDNASKAESENVNKKTVRPSQGGFAEITFQQMKYDFGTIEEGDVISHTFKFFNTGTGSLIISDATATCGCTRPDFPFMPIEPQTSGTINVTFNSTGKDGPQRKPITVISNATDRRMTVYLEGTVVPKGSLKKDKEILADPDSASSN